MKHFLVLLTILPLGFASGVMAQASEPSPKQNSESHADHSMPEAAKSVPASDPHAGHVMPTANPATGPQTQSTGPSPSPSPDPHEGHAMPADASPSMKKAQTGSEEPVGDEPPPPPITDHAADQAFGIDAMSRARENLTGEHGATLISKVMVNLAEYQSGPGGGRFRWDARAWYGGDLNRFVLKTEGEGSGNEGVELGEVQALYSRAIARYTDVQVGVRHDFEPGPQRTYATAGFETLLPYWFDVSGAVFLSEKGDLIGRLEGTYDLQLTQRVVLQPQAELRWSGQDISELGIGSGISHVELGLRLRYEIKREFAPYVGIAYERTFGRTTDFARARGEGVSSTRFVVGIRTWF